MYSSFLIGIAANPRECTLRAKAERTPAPCCEPLFQSLTPDGSQEPRPNSRSVAFDIRIGEQARASV